MWHWETRHVRSRELHDRPGKRREEENSQRTIHRHTRSPGRRRYPPAHTHTMVSGAHAISHDALNALSPSSVRTTGMVPASSLCMLLENMVAPRMVMLCYAMLRGQQRSFSGLAQHSEGGLYPRVLCSMAEAVRLDRARPLMEKKDSRITDRHQQYGSASPRMDLPNSVWGFQRLCYRVS